MKLLDGHVAVVGLGFGDEGKGSIVDWLCTQTNVEAVVRFNGGAQAAHNVVLPDGRHHTFSQWGSGTLRGVPTYLSRYMVVDPGALFNESAHLQELGVRYPFDMLNISSEALVTTPYHVIVNHVRELARGENRHGSVGVGFGTTVSHALDNPDAALKMWHLRSAPSTRTRLNQLRGWCLENMALHGFVFPVPTVDEADEVLLRLSGVMRLYDDELLNNVLDQGPVVFEGAQGVLLDEWYGFHPHTTWSTTTFDNISRLTDRNVYRLGVLRSYTTRHGTGPMPSEDPVLKDLREHHNYEGKWQGPFRIGHFDAVMHKYAVQVCGDVDGIALTHMDVIESTPYIKMIEAYGSTDTIGFTGIRDLCKQEQLTSILSKVFKMTLTRPVDWVAAVEQKLQVPVVVTSFGPTSDDKCMILEND